MKAKPTKAKSAALKEQPIRVVQHKGEKGHKTETRVFKRETWEHYCAQPDCEFYGQLAAQGICHTRLYGPDRAYLTRVNERAKGVLEEFRAGHRKHKGKVADWVKYLEGMVVCDWMNSEFTIQELIRLRAQVRTLENRSLRRPAKPKGR